MLEKFESDANDGLNQDSLDREDKKFLVEEIDFLQTTLTLADCSGTLFSLPPGRTYEFPSAKFRVILVQIAHEECVRDKGLSPHPGVKYVVIPVSVRRTLVSDIISRLMKLSSHSNMNSMSVSLRYSPGSSLLRSALVILTAPGAPGGYERIL